jgi:hypothetical protein
MFCPFLLGLWGQQIAESTILLSKINAPIDIFPFILISFQELGYSASFCILSILLLSFNDCQMFNSKRFTSW